MGSCRLGGLRGGFVHMKFGFFVGTWPGAGYQGLD
jgi:hypothetical protein